MATVNESKYLQNATFLEKVIAQAQGKEALSNLKTGDFVSLATTVKQLKNEDLLDSISNVIAKTTFAVRPYNSPLQGLYVSNEKFGDMTRKISYADPELEDDQSRMLVDGQSIDQYKVHKPKVLQTNFYGGNDHQITITTFKNQMDTAFNSPADLDAFMRAYMVVFNNKMATKTEAEARTCILNFIGGKIKEGSVIHLLTEYKADGGPQDIDKTNFSKPEYVKDFILWFYRKYSTLTDRLAERNDEYITKVTGYDIKRHTPAANLKNYFVSDFDNIVMSQVRPLLFNDDVLKNITFNKINYWQSLNKPYSVDVTPVIMNSDGTYKEAETAVNVDSVVGVLYDEDAMGITIKSEWSGTTPLNVGGGYYNTIYHFRHRYINDLTEKGVVLMLD